MLLLLMIDEVQPGMRLARTIYDPSGRPLLFAGVSLRKQYIDRLRDMGYSGVYVSEGKNDDIEVSSQLREAIKASATLAVQDSMKKMYLLNKTNKALVEEVVRLMVDDILSQPEVVVELIDIKALTDHTFGHSSNVAFLSIAIGKVMGLERSKLIELGIGSLLHDVGKVYVPEDILNKPGKLEPVEMDKVRQHTVEGFESLSRLGYMSTQITHVAYQHHERLDGSGYPRGLNDKEITVYAKICSVCDVYDAMTSDRPYKKAIHPAEGLLLLKSEQDRFFSKDVVNSLFRVVAPYPIATMVQLSSGEVAVVTDINSVDVERPVVRVIKNSEYSFYDSIRVIDLSKEEDLEIVRTVHWTEVIEFRNRRMRRDLPHS